MLDAKIGPYRLSRRTEFSKIQVTDEFGNVDKTEEGKRISEKIIADYLLQKDHEKLCFDIAGDTLFSFTNKSNVEYVFVPDGIMTIEKDAFAGSDVKLIFLPDSIFHIKQNAFKNCKKLEGINLPSSLKSSSNGMFDGCMSLKSISLPEGIREINLYNFANCLSLESVTIPDSVVFIDGHAFENCENLKKINIPKNLLRCGKILFARSGIETLVFNHDINKIEFPDAAFKNFLAQSQVYRLEINKDVHYIDANIFKYTDKNITQIDYIGSKDEFKEFKKNNKELFKVFKKAHININENLESIIGKKSNDFSKEDINLER